jgi:hypothetical protein
MSEYAVKVYKIVICIFFVIVIYTLAGLGNYTFFHIVGDVSLSHTIGAPIIEESFRCMSIIYSVIFGFPAWIYTILTSIHEFYMYLVSNADNLTVPFVMTRFSAIILHLTAYWFQMWGWSYYRDSKKKIWIVAGLVGAICIHALWNSTVGIWIYKLWCYIYLLTV